jgi:murein DD-endopeptidase MepM/ murein hydrolase activator NlpD
MRRWEIHRTRSKVALLLLINLVTLLGGKYTALITIFKIELFGEAMALAKTPKKKPPRSPIARVPSGHLSPQTFARQPAPRAAEDGALGFFIHWPVEGTLTSLFGTRDHVMGGGSAQFHAGIDIAVPVGTPVQAAYDGIVVFAGYNGAYGKAVKLEHVNGYSTLYAHNARLLVHVGQTIKAGQVICLSGSSGRSTGPHVHFEVHKDGWPVDPLDYLP